MPTAAGTDPAPAALRIKFITDQPARARAGAETQMRNAAVSYITTGLVFLALDAIWLTLAANLIYRPHLGPILREGFALAPAAVFYLIYVAGMVLFAVRPGVMAQAPLTALLYGAALGFVAYATYDLTNQATLKVWSTTVTLADLAWGTFVTAMASAAGCYLTLKISRLLGE